MPWNFNQVSLVLTKRKYGYSDCQALEIQTGKTKIAKRGSWRRKVVEEEEKEKHQNIIILVRKVTNVGEQF